MFIDFINVHSLSRTVDRKANSLIMRMRVFTEAIFLDSNAADWFYSVIFEIHFQAPEIR
jgi:hypothetical protein